MQCEVSSGDPQCALQKENAQKFHPMCKTLVWQTAVARFNQSLPAELEFQALKPGNNSSPVNLTNACWVRVQDMSYRLIQAHRQTNKINRYAYNVFPCCAGALNMVVLCTLIRIRTRGWRKKHKATDRARGPVCASGTPHRGRDVPRFGGPRKIDY